MEYMDSRVHINIFMANRVLDIARWDGWHKYRLYNRNNTQQSAINNVYEIVWQYITNIK